MSLSFLICPNRRCVRTGFLAWVAVSVAATLNGCRGSDSLPSLPVYQVTGKVVLADGKPLSGGFISFVPKDGLAVTPSSTIGPDGTFSLVTGGSGDGAPAGEYKVRVEAPQLQHAAARSKRRPVFPDKYRDEDSSGLVITVRADANQLEPIRLK
jgi:hypothetical protein